MNNYANSSNKVDKKHIFANPLLDWIFIVCPIWIGATYFISVKVLPEQRPFIFFIYLFFLGESHFGVTWLFIKNKSNRKWLLERKTTFVAIPLLLIISFVFLGIYSLRLAVYLLSLVSFFHITRQSIGLFKIYADRPTKHDESFIYFSTVFWATISFYRFIVAPFFAERFAFYSNHQTTLEILISTIGFLGIAVFLLMIFFRQRRHKNALGSASLAVSLLMFAPLGFVKYIQDATIIGVGIHWCQYLALNFKLYISNNGSAKRLRTTFYTQYALITFVFLYGFVMAGVLTGLGSEFSSNSLWILIPLVFEMGHFYIDAFIWKFSNPYIRETVGRKLFSESSR